jgi:hypothetical protein
MTSKKQRQLWEQAVWVLQQNSVTRAPATKQAPVGAPKKRAA